MIVGSQPERDDALQTAEALFAADSSTKHQPSRRLDQIGVRFCPEAGFHVPIHYEFETSYHETQLPALSETVVIPAVV